MNLEIDQNCNEKKILIWKLLIGTTEYKKKTLNFISTFKNL